MMKKITFYLTMAALLLCTLAAKAQTEVVTGLDNPQGIVILNDTLYVAEQGANRIVKIDLTAQTPTAVKLIDCALPSSLALNGNELIVAGQYPNNIYKMNLTLAAPKLDTIYRGLARPITDVVLAGNYLFLSEGWRDSGMKLLKMDISSQSPTVSEVLTNLNVPRGLALQGNTLYMAEYGGNKISKIDITANSPSKTDVLTGLTNTFGLAINGDYLYISQASVFIKKIVKFDIVNGASSAVDVLTSGIGPKFMAFKDNIMYFSDLGTSTTNGKILKYDISGTGIDNSAASAVTLFPNPATNYLQVSGLAQATSYSIYNSIGAMAQSGLATPNKAIDIQALSAGVYVFVVGRERPVKFIKE